MSITRRHVLKGLGVGSIALAGGLAAPALWAQTPVDRPKGKRVVVIGGGLGGATAAAELRRLAPEVEVLVIEPAETFLSGASTLEYVFGAKTLEQAGRSYAGLAQQGVRMVRAEAKTVDPVQKVVGTTAGAFAYTQLILASGIRLAPDEIPGLAEARGANLTPYDRGHLAELKRRIEGFAGGTAVIGIPVGALKCPPAPYEYALLLAGRIKQRKLKGRVVLIDAWPTPQPGGVADGFQAAIDSFGALIEYVPQGKVERVEAAGKKVRTADGDEFECDLLSLIPPNRAWGLVKDLGLNAEADVFVDVEPLTQRSRKFDTLYAVGDVARTPFGKNGGAAADTGTLCAQAIARAFGVPGVPSGPGRVRVACYPFVEPTRALAVETGFTLTPKAGADPVLDMKSTPDAQPGAGNLAKRRAWEARALKAAFGA
ncbi:MAG: FAD/NAD(P)-binding oxidoreductase [Pseudomonadota bacterium]